MTTITRSQQLRQRANAVLVGGVSAGWNVMTGDVPYFTHGKGMHLFDVDGNEYIDYMAGHSSLLLGHDPPALQEAIAAALSGRFGCQCETELHVQLAEVLCEVVPCAEAVRLANSGTETTMHAIRLARAHTGRDVVVKFEGHFHGMHDAVLYATDKAKTRPSKRADGSLTPVHGCAGMPKALDDLTITVRHNDEEGFASVMRAHGHRIAAVILEPIAFNMGYVPSRPGFLKTVRSLATEYGAVLIFDEVLTGFRVALGGAQERYGVIPDLACYSKALGAGAPVAALCGSRAVMNGLSPSGGVTMSGTNTGRWLTVGMTLAALGVYRQPGFYDRLTASTQRVIAGLREIFARHDVPAFVAGEGGCVGVYFGLTSQPIDVESVLAGWNRPFTLAFHLHMLRRKHVFDFVQPLGTNPERITITSAHTAQDLDETLDRVDQTLAELPYFEERA